MQYECDTTPIYSYVGLLMLEGRFKYVSIQGKKKNLS